MSLNLDGWFALSPRMRLLCWLTVTLCNLALVWWLVLSPLHNRQAQLSSQQLARDAAQQAQWRKLRALALPVNALPLADAVAFSPLDFQAQGRQLLRWQPASAGGEMELETRWPEALDTFLLLAERDMLIPSFSLEAGENALRLTLKLERDDGR